MFIKIDATDGVPLYFNETDAPSSTPFKFESPTTTNGTENMDSARRMFEGIKNS